jgi:hypothetical protein
LQSLEHTENAEMIFQLGLIFDPVADFVFGEARREKPGCIISPCGESAFGLVNMSRGSGMAV